MVNMINREEYLTKIASQFKVHRIVTLLGPRQCGKTTLARQYIGENFPKVNYFDLENLVDIERLANPRLSLEPLSGLIVIDEIQRKPDLFPYLRYLHDTMPDKSWLLLGSPSKEIINQTSETLAGRIGYIEVTPFTTSETNNDTSTLWFRGGFPKSYLAIDDESSYLWLRDFVNTYAEKDIPSLGIKIAPENIRRFWRMVTHYHGQILNSNELASSLILSRPTIVSYIDILKETFMLRVLRPWHANISKRQVKSPKIYLRDSGIYHYLLGIRTKEDLLLSPKLGASWEGFALEQVIHHMDCDENDCYFWATHNNAELDLIIFKGNKAIGFEFKYQDAPKLTSSMRVALTDLDLSEIVVIYPGDKDYVLSDKVKVMGLRNFVSLHSNK
jgi:predicted AAA+ superfamily ATPase